MDVANTLKGLLNLKILKPVSIDYLIVVIVPVLTVLLKLCVGSTVLIGIHLGIRCFQCWWKRRCLLMNNCKGCRTYMIRKERSPNDSARCRPDMVNTCPCISCIVKPMCTKECKEYADIREQRIKKDLSGLCS